MNSRMAADLARDRGEKLAGAKAEEGANLDSVTDLAKQVIDNVRSMGLALTSCTVPAAGSPTFDLGDDEVEIGIGIHGEPGRERIKMESGDQLTDRITRPVIEDLRLTSGERVLVFVN